MCIRDSGIGMDATSEERCEVTQLITSQSAHINRGVVQSIDDQGAGDQGLMFGYACNETEAYPEHKGRWMPLAIALAQALTRRVSNAGSDGNAALGSTGREITGDADARKRRAAVPRGQRGDRRSTS